MNGEAGDFKPLVMGAQSSRTRTGDPAVHAEWYVAKLSGRGGSS
jgi:hypothetical protein